MSSTIVVRTISAAPEAAIQMSNSSWARPITLPSTWSKVRIGLRFHFAPSVSPGAGTNFVCGLGSGVTNIIGDYLTTNFIGVSSNGSFSIASAEFQNFTNSVVKKVGTAYTVGAALDNPNIKFLPVNAVATADRNAYYIEITKGSPNYTVDVLMGNAPSDVTAASFATEIVKPSPAFAGGVYSLSSNGAKAIAFDETAGTLNSVQCWWNSTTSLPEICDLAVVLLA